MRYFKRAIFKDLKHVDLSDNKVIEQVYLFSAAVAKWLKHTEEGFDTK